MRKDEIQELRLMEEVSKKEGNTTQRELARSLNMSLGLVNAFIKRIVRKGYFKVTTIPGRRVCYLMTPRGLAEKSRLTAEYLRYSLSYYREIRFKMQELVQEMKNNGIKRVAIVGTGELGELYLLSFQEADIEISQVLSLEGNVNKFLGYTVRPLSALDKDFVDAICLAELDSSEQIIRKLEELGIPKERIVRGSNIS